MAANKTNVDEDPTSTKTNARRHPIETPTNGWTTAATPSTDKHALNAQNYLVVLHNALVNECNRHLYKSITVPLNSTQILEATIRAVKDHKIFSVLGYFPKVSEELRKRGWTEKRDPHRPPIDYSYYIKSSKHVINWIESPPLVLSSAKSIEETIKERLKTEHSWTILKDKPSDLIFVTRKRLVNWSTLNELTVVSQMPRHMFCSKNGLAQCLENYKHTVSNLMFPRCHYIRTNEDYDAFVDDYVTTALIGTLKIVVKAIGKNRTIFSLNGTIPYKMVDFTIQCVFKFLCDQRAGYRKKDMWKFNDQKDIWIEFIKYYTKLIMDDNAKFCQDYTDELEEDVYATCKYLLEQVKTYCPQYYMDGSTNMWIIKPTYSCSGHGIILSRDLYKIKKISTFTDESKQNYILQKYIETPLLVYACKVDLRQWFLVTDMNPIVVWMYKEGYVRFCANTFSMKNMHESVHLSNVRLQMKYRKMGNSNVPEENMWDFKQFKNHLTIIGQPYAWDELIFPGMSENIFAVLKATTDVPYYRNKTFQLFGADFVITDNYVPYLIEINSAPGLNPSTSIIANLTPMLLEDIIKVVVDYGNDPNADTGLFMKVEPEILTSTTVAADPAKSSAKTEKSEAAATAVAATTYQETEKVNDELPTVRTVTAQKVKTDADTPADPNRVRI